MLRMRKLSGFVGWSKQNEVIRALYKHRLVTVRSSHGVGKTAVAGALVDDFFSQGPCRVVTTAPTWEQVRDLLWGEIRARVDAALIPWQSKPTQARWKIRNDWLAVGLSTNRPERFQGHHGKRVLFVVDEASGVDETIFDAGMGFLTGEHSYVLYLGNPTQTRGEFYHSHQPDSGFHAIHINTFMCPAFTGEELDPALTDVQFPSQQWEQMILRRVKGKKDHPEYRVRVLGEFANLVGRAYFDDSDLDALDVREPKRVGRLVGDPVRDGKHRITWEDDSSGHTRIWCAPQKGHRYVIFGDVAGQVREVDWLERDQADPGEGNDYCAAQVLDIASGEQVAELHARMDPDLYAEELARLGWVYGESDRVPAWLGVESNGVGQATLAVLKGRARNHRYPRIFRRQQMGVASQSKAAALGLVTTRDSRERMLAFLKETVREAPGRIHSARLRDECRSFEYRPNGYGGHASGCHDDTVIAMAGALEMRDQVLRRPAGDEVAA